MRRILYLFALVPSLAQAAPFIHAAHDHRVLSANTTYYIVPDGYTQEYTTEAPAQFPYFSSGTISQAWAYLIANSLVTKSVITLRVNGADTPISITISSNTTGAFEDKLHFVTLNYGDKIDWKVVTGGGVSMQLNAALFLFDATSNSMMKFVATGAGGATGVTNGFADFYTSPANIMG